MHGVNVYPNIDCVWFQPLGFRRGHQSELFRTSGMGSNPLLCQIQVSCEGNWVATRKFGKRFACLFLFAIEKGFDES